jgi:tetratricopeptide (TPR) repeat protein
LLAKRAEAADYPKTVATTWDLAFKEVANTSPAATELLNVAAFLAPDGIPRALFTTIGDDVGLPDQLAEALKNPLRFDDLVIALRQYSLIDVEADTFAVHRLVQGVTRDRLDEPSPYVEAAVQLVANAFPFDLNDPATWTTTAAMLPHATTVLDHANKTDTATQNLSWLHTAVGRYLHITAQYTPALYHLEQALAIDEASYGPDHPTVAVDLNNLALLFQDTNRYEEAEPLMRRALAIDEASHGPDHPEVAVDLNNLAALLQATNRSEEAEPLMRRALTIDEASYGPDHPEVAVDLNNLAQLLEDTNRSEEAEPLMLRALDITETSYGPDHPTVAIRLNNLAQLLEDSNRYDEAEPLMRRVLAIDEASYGPDHPTVAIRLNNLANLFQATNRYEEAEPLMRRALAIDEASYELDHPNVARDLNNLATLFMDTNRYEEAEPLMRRLVEILAAFTKRTGHEHPHQGTAFANYAGLLQAMGRSEKEISAAVELMQRGPYNAEE